MTSITLHLSKVASDINLGSYMLLCCTVQDLFLITAIPIVIIRSVKMITPHSPIVGTTFSETVAHAAISNVRLLMSIGVLQKKLYCPTKSSTIVVSENTSGAMVRMPPFISTYSIATLGPLAGPHSEPMTKVKLSPRENCEQAPSKGTLSSKRTIVLCACRFEAKNKTSKIGKNLKYFIIIQD